MSMQTQIQESLAGWERGCRGADIPLSKPQPSVPSPVLFPDLGPQSSQPQPQHTLSPGRRERGVGGIEGRREEMPPAPFFKNK